MHGDFQEKLKYIEANFPVETVTYNDIPLWPFLRVSINSCYAEDLWVEKNVQTNNSVLRSVLRLILWPFLRSYRFFRTCLIFAVSLPSLLISLGKKHKIVFIHGIDPSVVKMNKYDRLIQEFLNQNKKSDIVLFLRFIFIKKEKYLIKYIHIHKIALYVNAFYESSFSSKNIKNANVLDDVISYLGIKYDYTSQIKYVIIHYNFFYNYFQRTKPRYVFISDYYNPFPMSAIYAAKKLGIKTIESQHGTIFSHPSYSIFNKEIIDNCYPEYFLCFGEKSKKVVSPFFCKQENIFEVGSFWIDFVKGKKDEYRKLFNEKYKTQIAENKIIITVSLQSIFNLCMDFCIDIANKRDDIFFVFVPRNQDCSHVKHKNISIETELDVYQCCMFSNLHLTVNSTVWMESLVFGTPSIIVNEADAPLFDESLIEGLQSVKVVNNYNEFDAAVSELLSLPRDKVVKEGELFYANNHSEKFSIAMNEILNRS